jgi:hypothetical protein
MVLTGVVNLFCFELEPLMGKLRKRAHDMPRKLTDIFLKISNGPMLTDFSILQKSTSKVKEIADNETGVKMKVF